jgi:hypothetical protein
LLDERPLWLHVGEQGFPDLSWAATANRSPEETLVDSVMRPDVERADLKANAARFV